MTPRASRYALAAFGAAATALFSIAMRPATDTAEAIDGASLFRLKGCAACHDVPDGASSTGAGPSLSGAPTWAADRVAGMTADEYLAQSMRTPSAFVAPGYAGAGAPGPGQMPLLQLSDEEIDAIVDYLLEPRSGRSDTDRNATD